jgi:hypothetical protein
MKKNKKRELPPVHSKLDDIPDEDLDKAIGQFLRDFWERKKAKYEEKKRRTDAMCDLVNLKNEAQP